MVHAGQPAQIADRLAVVGVLVEVHPVLRHLDAGGQTERVGRLIFNFRVRLERCGDEVLVEVGQRSVYPGSRIARGLIAVGIRPLVPHAGPEDSACGFVFYGENVAHLAIAV